MAVALQHLVQDTCKWPLSAPPFTSAHSGDPLLFLLFIRRTVLSSGVDQLLKVSVTQSQCGAESKLAFLFGKRPDPGLIKAGSGWKEKKACAAQIEDWLRFELPLTLSEGIEMGARLLFIILNGNCVDSFHYARPNLDEWKGRLSNYWFYMCA